MESILDWNTKEGDDLPRRLRLRDQPLQHPRLDRAALARAASPPARSASCAAPTPGPARSSPAARPGARRRWSSSTSTIRTSRTSSGARPTRRRRPAALRDAGFDMSIDGDGFTSIQYQNANNSVRVTDEFMEAVEAGDDWDLTARNGRRADEDAAGARPDEPDRRRRLALRRPGRPVRHDRSTAGTPARSRGGSTPRTRAREYMHVDDSACNLASLNLMKFRRDGRQLRRRRLRARRRHRLPRPGDRRRLRRATRPRRSARNARAFRQLGLGYANLGALLMSDGLPYDSDEGRDVAARDHRADDRPRLPQVGRDRRRRSGPTTSTRRTASRTTA